ncbi:unnamed protein product [Lathyrus sativus]|nr:unnamed protein product [Lathyrus sativus]
MLPIEEKYDLDFDFEKGRLILAQGAELYVESPEGKYMPRSVSIILNSEAKVIITKYFSIYRQRFLRVAY